MPTPPKRKYSATSQKYYSGEKALTRAEYDRLLAVCDDHEDRVMLMLAVSLGLRRSDLVGVLVQDIDLVDGMLTYREKKKGNRSRTVPMPPKLRSELAIYIKSRNLRGGPLFDIKDRQAHNRFNTLCEKAGIEKRPIHALRATCVKFCRDAGWTVEQTAKLIGDEISTVQRHYSVPSQGELVKAMNEKEII